MRKLYIDPGGGLAGDIFISSLISLGASADTIRKNMKKAADYLGYVELETQISSDGAVRLQMDFHPDRKHLKGKDARHILSQLYTDLDIKQPYRRFGHQILEKLIGAERTAHSEHHFVSDHFHVSPIGVAHSPYHSRAPFRPDEQAEGNFYIEVFPAYQQGLKDVETFSHVMVLGYFDRSEGYTLEVSPPWIDATVGLFASRSPFRPNPIGVNILKMKGVEENYLYTSPGDFLDNTPVLDIKPVISDLDKVEEANNGWLQNTNADHPSTRHPHADTHHHAEVDHGATSEDAMLHEAQDIIMDIIGVVTGMQLLDIDPKAGLVAPLAVGGGYVNFSHGSLPVPAPATSVILTEENIPWKYGPLETELTTPTGAAILGAFDLNMQDTVPGNLQAKGYGRGSKDLDIPPLKLYIA